MADEIKSGRPWQDDELDAIIEDYFAMLKAEISGEFYVKSAVLKGSWLNWDGRTGL